MAENKPVFSDYEVRVRAFRIWEQRGKPEGEADEHWREALAELEAEFAIKNVSLVPDRPDVSVPPVRIAAVPDSSEKDKAA